MAGERLPLRHGHRRRRRDRHLQLADGTVTAVGDSSQLGNYVTVSHAGAFTTLYAHCSRITASSGQQVALGDPIAEVGETGNATGPHLHFALQKDTVYLDPAYYGIG